MAQLSEACFFQSPIEASPTLLNVGVPAADVAVDSIPKPLTRFFSSSARFATNFGPGTSTLALCFRESDIVRATLTSAAGLGRITVAMAVICPFPLGGACLLRMGCEVALCGVW